MQQPPGRFCCAYFISAKSTRYANQHLYQYFKDSTMGLTGGSWSLYTGLFGVASAPASSSILTIYTVYLAASSSGVWPCCALQKVKHAPVLGDSNVVMRSSHLELVGSCRCTNAALPYHVCPPNVGSTCD